MASRVEDYGLIGNLHTTALVSRGGSIDWFCAPRFDSEACFASLVGYDEHGRWLLRPGATVRRTVQRYRGDTLVLETEFGCDSGTIRVIDFMPIGTQGSDIVRIIEGVQGEVPVEMVLDVRFGYGKSKPWVTADGGTFQFVAGPDAMILRAPFELSRRGAGVSGSVNVKVGDRLAVHLAWYPSHQAQPAALDATRELAATESFWTDWAGKCRLQGPLRDTVMRSLLTLKALIHAPTGAIAAAPTTSLPEQLGGVRNWDYRFCWLRDASLSLDALLLCGYIDEARQFRDWLLRAVAGDPADIQIMYDLSGGRRLTEFENAWLPGYEGSKPVRVGNAASGQFQLDVYGEVMLAIYLARKRGLSAHSEGFGTAKALADFLDTAWQRPDDGIWEVRGGRRHFTYSKVMAWVAFDRIVRIIEEYGDGGEEGARMLPHLRTQRARIHEEVCERGFNPRVGAFTQSYGSELLDASALLIPHTGFLPASDPRMVGTVQAIERSLLRDGFVLRYGTEHGTDGLPGSEGAFLACSFWLADNYAVVGRVDEAQALFDRLLGLRNHLGLLAEEYEPALRRQIGNFPQAFSHLALITTAWVLDGVRAKAENVEAPAEALRAA